MGTGVMDLSDAPIPEAAMRDFKNIGFVVFKNFYDRAAMDEIATFLDRLREKRPGSTKDATYFEKSTTTGENILVRIEHFLGDHNQTSPSCF